MTPRKTIKITTFSASGYEAWAPDEFLMKIAAAIALIPEKERAEGGTGVVELDGNEQAWLRIEYQREENDEEHAERLAKEAAAAKKHEAWQRQQYEALKAKFG